MKIGGFKAAFSEKPGENEIGSLKGTQTIHAGDDE